MRRRRAPAGTRWSSPTSLLNVSPRCSKSRNWSNDAHAGARRTTGPPARSAQAAAAAWRTALARSPLCVQGRVPPAPGRSPRPPRRSDRRGARDPARAARRRGRRPWAARRRSSRCDRSWRARGRRLRIGRLAVVDELHAVERGHGLQAMGEARELRQPGGDRRGRDAERAHRAVGRGRILPVVGAPQAGDRAQIDDRLARVRPPRRTAGRRSRRRRAPAGGRPRSAARAAAPGPASSS